MDVAIASVLDGEQVVTHEIEKRECSWCLCLAEEKKEKSTDKIPYRSFWLWFWRCLVLGEGGEQDDEIDGPRMDAAATG